MDTKDKTLMENTKMWTVSWDSPDGFFGVESFTTEAEAKEVERDYLRQGCKVSISEQTM